MQLTVKYPDTPKGKRSFRINVYGNVIGYVSGKRFWEFGTGINAEDAAATWETGASLKLAITGEP